MKLPAIAVVVAFAAASPAHAWTDHTVYTPAAGASVIGIAVAGGPLPVGQPGTGFYVVFEVQDTVASTHTLYLQLWNGFAFWTSPLALDSHGAAWIYNPSIVTRPDHVTITAHGHNPACGPTVTSLREIDYQISAAAVVASTVIDAPVCNSIGHSQVVFSSGDSTYHACWTRQATATGDEVWCGTRATTAASWTIAGVSGGAAHNQDHGSVAVKRGSFTRRVAFHDQTANVTNGDNDVRLIMSNPGGGTVEYRAPGGAVPEPGWQDHPFLALSPDDKLHLAWEDGNNFNEVIKYARCLNATPGGCDAAAEWELDNVAISQTAGVSYAHTPHLLITDERTWVSYEQKLAAGPRDVEVRHRCLSAAFNAAWTAEDPAADTVDELTEEFGTPHLSSRAGAIGLPLVLVPPVIGVVSLRQQAVGSPSFDGKLYELTEPACP